MKYLLLVDKEEIFRQALKGINENRFSSVMWADRYAEFIDWNVSTTELVDVIADELGVPIQYEYGFRIVGERESGFLLESREDEIDIELFPNDDLLESVPLFLERASLLLDLGKMKIQ